MILGSVILRTLKPSPSRLRATRRRAMRSGAVVAGLAIAATGLFGLVPADAARLENRVAVFSGLDKITGRITTFDAYVNETVQFGTLQVTPRVCYSRSPDEAPKTDSFVEVDEITLDREIRRIFTGWMFADSPGLNAVEHPVYDVWLKDCSADSSVPPPPEG
uniref:Cellulase-like protein n=1 Tax=Aureimonas frigidaquae TaxID=424757 RepID=A0A0P0Z487_9HYPH|nr:cellulase-like protein [Aureimonas frigidaquae]